MNIQNIFNNMSSVFWPRKMLLHFQVNVIHKFEEN